MEPISVIMPYWNREAALLATLDSYAKWYGPELEVVIAVDGCPTPSIGSYPFAVKFVNLPPKDHPLNPCVPFNRGADAASHRLLGLTNPEVSHPRGNVLHRLAEAIAGNPLGYAIAACWDVTGRWYQHSQHRPRNYHWMSMLHAALFRAVGGFSEEYRDGTGYDDDDLLYKLRKQGAQLMCFDDLVVVHDSSTDCGWGDGGRRNRDIFQRKSGSG